MFSFDKHRFCLPFKDNDPPAFISGVVANGNKLYVVGGDDGSSNLGSVEVYDPASNKWTLLMSSMMTGRSYAGVTVIERPIL